MQINQVKFEESLRQNIKFVNYLGSEKNDIIHSDSYIQDRINEKNSEDAIPPAGFYITDFFLKSNEGDTVIGGDKNYKFANLYEDKKTLNEKIAIDNQKSSSVVQKLNRNISNIVKKEMNIKTADATEQNIGYFFIAFPVVIQNDIFIILINFLDLPFEVEFEFNKNNSNNRITAQLLVNDRKISDYNNIITNGLRNMSAISLHTRLFQVKEKNKSPTYTDFLKELYSKKFAMFEEIKNSKDLNGFKIKISNEQNHLITFESTDENTKTVHLKPMQAGIKNIVYHEKSKDARKMYWGNCIVNEKNLNDLQTNKISNYFDIAFDCRYLKAFSFSNYTAGFHVIDYQPSEIFKEITLGKNLYGVINLFEVYKQVFLNKIIELEAIPVI
jgi:hypothetical protein